MLNLRLSVRGQARMSSRPNNQDMPGGSPSSRGNYREDVPHEWCLYVGRLPGSVTVENLLYMFSPFSEILNVAILKPKSYCVPAKTWSYAFINMSNYHGAMAAMEQFNGRLVFGSLIRVESARGKFYSLSKSEHDNDVVERYRHHPRTRQSPSRQRSRRSPSREMRSPSRLRSGRSPSTGERPVRRIPPPPPPPKLSEYNRRRPRSRSRSPNRPSSSRRHERPSSRGATRRYHW